MKRSGQQRQTMARRGTSATQDNREARLSRSPRRRAMMYEVFVYTEGGRGRQLDDRELIAFVPAHVDHVPVEGMPNLTLAGARRDVLRVRARIVRRYPDASIDIFEFPVAMQEELSGASAFDFVLSADRLTLVVPPDYAQRAATSRRVPKPRQPRRSGAKVLRPKE